jgi:hypothetical protein
VTKRHADTLRGPDLDRRIKPVKPVNTSAACNMQKHISSAASSGMPGQVVQEQTSEQNPQPANFGKATSKPMHAAPYAPIQHATPSALHAAPLLCFFCEGEAAKCDCGKFDAVTEDPITADGQYRIDAYNRLREERLKNPPPVCVQKSWKGLTCETILNVSGSRCRVCPLRKSSAGAKGKTTSDNALPPVVKTAKRIGDPAETACSIECLAPADSLHNS